MPYPGWTPTPGCLANIQKYGGRVCSDPDTHCYDTQDYTHQVCDCSGEFLGGCTSSPPPLPPGCCHYTGDSAIPSYDRQGMCYCCCSCFAYDTPIAYSLDEEGPAFRVVQDFAIGDPVLAADANLNWSVLPLQFSSGAPAKKSTLIKVDYLLDGEERSLLVTRAQLFYMPDGKLIRADRLLPQDMLVVANGGSTPVVALTAGIFDKGVHHVATSSGTATGVDGHLLNSNGIVTGDYALQISSITHGDKNSLLVDDHAERPVFGTEEHAAAAAEIADGTSASTSGYAASGQQTAASDGGPVPEPSAPADKSAALQAKLTSVGAAPHAVPEGFTALLKGNNYPADTQSYFTDAQAWDIQISGQRAPVGSPVGSDMVQYVLRLFDGMYPNINFQFDEHDDTPNAYAFEQYNMRFVVFTSGLARTNPLVLESAAAIVAHCVARLQKIEPVNQSGYTCRSIADYATPSVLGFVFRGGLFGTVMTAAITQLEALYALVSPDNAKPVQGDTCMRPGLDCRLETLRASMRGMPKPECAGGPPAATLRLVSAEGQASTDEESCVTLTFSDPVDATTVNFPANYQFEPPTIVTGAELDSTDATKVIVHSQATPDTKLIDVIGVVSDDGHRLQRSASSADINWK